MNSDDIAHWPDGTWCYGDELEHMTHMSDDYETLVFGTDEHVDFLLEQE